MFEVIKIWLMYTRPASLWICGVPVFMGTAMAFADGVAHFPSAIAALFGAFLIHSGCNLTNDYWDFKRGSNQRGEIDPMRGFAVGTINQQSLKIACVIIFLLALLPCIFLIQRSGLIVLLIAATALFSAIFYTAGNKSLAYQGWGDLFAFLFFGPIAVAGTYYVQSHEMNLAIILSGIAPGLFAVAVLTINNIRDIEKDQKVNKLTLAVRFGKTFALYEYLASVIGIVLTPILVYSLTQDHKSSLLAALVGFWAIPVITQVLTAREEMDYNRSIGGTIKILIIYGAIFSLGWLF